MKVIIAGGRDFNNIKLLSESCNKLLQKYNKKYIEIVSGTAQGADLMGELYATSHNLKLKRFPADWSIHGRSAGPIRNKQMAEYADALIAFWDGRSRGTKNMINIAKKLGLKIKIINYD